MSDMAIALPVDAYGGVTQVGALVPFDCKNCPVVPADTNPVVLAALCQGTPPAVPPVKLVIEPSKESPDCNS